VELEVKSTCIADGLAHRISSPEGSRAGMAISASQSNST
jgi:hypothetical protein